MAQQVLVKSEASVALKPLIESAIKDELKVLKLGMEKTLRRLRDFEERFGMSSADFESRFTAGELPETLDFIEWLGEIETLNLLKSQLQALEKARVV